VLVSIPYTTALIPVDDEYTTICCVGASTIPVRSNTPFAGSVAPYSIYSAVVGVPVVEIATLIVTPDAFLLQTDSDATVNVPDGAVYTVVLVVAPISDAPNLPVAIIYFSVILLSKKVI
jgi:hypothetical protein